LGDVVSARRDGARVLAVLEQALVDLRGRASDDHTALREVRAAWRARKAREAQAWVDSDNEAWPFSFVSLCHVLGLDPTAVREALAGRRGPFVGLIFLPGLSTRVAFLIKYLLRP
jgi:hypothetical protein